MSSSGESGWEGASTHLYWNQEHKQVINQKLDHLKENYDGVGDFVLEKLRQEETLSLEEKIRELENKKQEIEEQEQQLRQVLREREQQQTLQDKKELLRRKQEKLKTIEREGVTSLHDLMIEEIEKRESRGYEMDEGILRTCLKRAESVYEKQPDVDELRRDVERLQDEVSELNGGREEWFLDLDSVEVLA